MSIIYKNAVIQANDNAEEWCGCLLVVDEVNPSYVRAYMSIPFQGDAYINLGHNQYEYIGRAAMVLVDEEDEDDD